MGKKTPEERLKKLAKDVTEAAGPIIRNVTEAAEPIIEDVRSKAEPVIKDVVNKADPVIRDVVNKADPVIKDVVNKADPVISKVKEKAEPAAKKAGEAAKSVGDNISMQISRRNVKEEVFVQYNNHEVRAVDILDVAKLDYINKGHKASDINEIQIYIKPLDNAAYYVVNHCETGKIEL